MGSLFESGGLEALGVRGGELEALGVRPTLAAVGPGSALGAAGGVRGGVRGPSSFKLGGPGVVPFVELGVGLTRRGWGVLLTVGRVVVVYRIFSGLTRNRTHE